MGTNGKIKVALEHPIEVEGLGLVRVVEVRDRVLVADLMAANKASDNGFVQDVTLFARLCGLLPSDMERMDADDFRAIGAAVAAAKKARGAVAPPSQT
jgi:hypothetical protein